MISVQHSVPCNLLRDLKLNLGLSFRVSLTLLFLDNLVDFIIVIVLRPFFHASTGSTFSPNTISSLYSILCIFALQSKLNNVVYVLILYIVASTGGGLNAHILGFRLE